MLPRCRGSKKAAARQGCGLHLILLATTPGQKPPFFLVLARLFGLSGGLKKPLACGILGVLNPSSKNHTARGAKSLHTEYTTEGQGRQVLTPVDLHDGAPQGYWVKDDQGRVYHTYTEDELPLTDRSPTGKVRPWRERHAAGLLLGEIYATMAEMVGGLDSPAIATVTLPDVTTYKLDSTGAPVLDPDGKPVPDGPAVFHAPLPKAKSGPAVWLEKARRLESCAQLMEYARAENGQLTLHKASFCRVRLCPMCQWRRSLKLGAQVRQVVERANATHIKETGAPWRWLMVTFTVRNVEGPELGAAIDTIHKGLNNMTKCKRWRTAVRGWLRATEVTHNTNPRSGAYDTYHPHMHMLLCVPASYFSGKGYIRQKDWAELWGHYIGADYTPIVDVRPIKPEGGGRLADLPAGEQAAAMGKACAEVSKYAAKPADYIVPSDLSLSMSAVQVLDAMLDRRRMTSWGGLLKEIAKLLQLDDPESGDLVHIDETASTDPVAEELASYVSYRWAVGARDYLPAGRRQGQTPAAERAQHAADRRAVKAGRTAAQQQEDTADWWTVETYTDMHSWDKGMRRAAIDDLRHLPRAVIERRLQESIGDVPEGWEQPDDKKT